jgi:SAM-dependent methyltransferase
MLKEINRVLKPGGILLLTAPQMARLHGEPRDFYRFTRWGLRYLLENNGFEIALLEPHGGICRALGSHINLFLAERCGRSRVVLAGLRYTLISLLNWLCPLLDRLVRWEKDTLNYNVLARKSSSHVP